MNKKEKEQYLKLKKIFEFYKLSNKDMRYIWKIIKPIYLHEEFQRRMTDPFFHHCTITVGEHIIGDTILVYKTCKRYKLSPCVIKRAILISMFHDLYEIPWPSDTKELFINYHAFVHPIEAIVNAITWFPKYFENIDDAKIIIDSVLHHMFPCPVRAMSNKKLELNNIETFNKLPGRYKKIIYKSLKSYVFKDFSLRKSYYLEGRILCSVDKTITIRNDLKIFKLFSFIKNIFVSEK